MSDWNIETTSGESLKAHTETRGRVSASERSDIETAERAANAANRTLVFVRLFTDAG